jgi:hypothetical protein
MVIRVFKKFLYDVISQVKRDFNILNPIGIRARLFVVAKTIELLIFSYYLNVILSRVRENIIYELLMILIKALFKVT